jgi:dTDP-4-dehydrorhamnose reductase
MMDKIKTPDLWAGVECTLNRVGDRYLDQLEFNGHLYRIEDLDLFARLGISAIRYPILWERTAPESLEELDWTWADERLARLRELGIRPIVGLVHHGSGPRYTDLLDPEFPEKLAVYARKVAERYPWVTVYTPVNEPLTTARFSGLYGHWYPHQRSDRAFVRALWNQVRATQLAMQAVRQVNPQAMLIQTEDMGKVFSTQTLSYQADYENERRWLSLDLLSGSLERDGMMYRYLTWAGLSEEELETVLEEASGPDIIGINHYMTSERYLDERLDRYPPHTHGGNGRHAYADIEVVRVCSDGPAGPSVLLRETWDRYQIPLAVTEVHLGSTREEQVRWLLEVWESAVDLRRQGVDLVAITAWSLLGSYNWHNLVTSDEGRYESGIFDLRGEQPRPTLLAKALTSLSQQKAFNHPILAEAGWWRRSQRLLYPPVLRQVVRASAVCSFPTPASKAPPLLITGANGMLGQAFAKECKLRGLSCLLMNRSELDISSPETVEKVIQEFRPWAVINAAGYTKIDEAERNPDLCRRANLDGPAALALICKQTDLPFLTFSSAHVFDGEQSSPYTESSRLSPLNMYGMTKAEAEERVLEIYPQSLLIRAGAYFSPWAESHFLARLFKHLRIQKPFMAADDQTLSPTYLPDLVNTSLDLLLDGEHGVWHLANQGEVSWYEFAQLAAASAGLQNGNLGSCKVEQLKYIAPRPRYCVLSSERGLLLPPLDEAVRHYVTVMDG